MSEQTSMKIMRERDMQQVSNRQKVTKVLVQVMLYLFLGIMALIVVFPFYWMIITSLKDFFLWEKEITPDLFPKDLMWNNYAKAFKTANLGRLFFNTVLVGVISTILSLVITVLSAFAFARLEFKGRDAMFAFLLATMMIPGELFTISNYGTVNRFGWYEMATNSGNVYSKFTQGLAANLMLIIPFLVSVFYIYLLRQNFMQIPNELYLAAKVDGTGDFKYLWKVMIPLALPNLISITILKMMGAWNTYMWPRLVIQNPDYYLITVGLRDADFKVNNGPKINIPEQMAAVTLVSIPLFLVFIFLRKYIMKGVSRSGIKG